MVKAILLVGLGGGLGSILRYLTTELCDKLFDTVYPVGTFIVNIIGGFMLGLLIGWLDARLYFNPHLRLLFLTGFCGGFTTFSAFSADSMRLFEAGYPITAIFYILSSVLTGLFCLWCGLEITK